MAPPSPAPLRLYVKLFEITPCWRSWSKRDHAAVLRALHAAYPDAVSTADSQGGFAQTPADAEANRTVFYGPQLPFGQEGIRMTDLRPLSTAATGWTARVDETENLLAYEIGPPKKAIAKTRPGVLLLGRAHLPPDAEFVNELVRAFRATACDVRQYATQKNQVHLRGYAREAPGDRDVFPEWWERRGTQHDREQTAARARADELAAESAASASSSEAKLDTLLRPSKGAAASSSRDLTSNDDDEIAVSVITAQWENEQGDENGHLGELHPDVVLGRRLPSRASASAPSAATHSARPPPLPRDDRERVGTDGLHEEIAVMFMLGPGQKDLLFEILGSNFAYELLPPESTIARRSGRHPTPSLAVESLSSVNAPSEASSSSDVNRVEPAASPAVRAEPVGIRETGERIRRAVARLNERVDAENMRLKEERKLE